MTEERPKAAPVKRAERRLPLRVLAIAAGIPIAGFAAMIALRAPGGEDSRFTISESEPAKARRTIDPLMAELERCRTLPADAVDDRCRAAWEVNHRRFMGESRSLVLPEPEASTASPTQEGH